MWSWTRALHLDFMCSFRTKVDIGRRRKRSTAKSYANDVSSRRSKWHPHCSSLLTNRSFSSFFNTSISLSLQSAPMSAAPSHPCTPSYLNKASKSPRGLAHSPRSTTILIIGGNMLDLSRMCTYSNFDTYHYD